jgi:hypothetical protein
MAFQGKINTPGSNDGCLFFYPQFGHEGKGYGMGIMGMENTPSVFLDSPCQSQGRYNICFTAQGKSLDGIPALLAPQSHG